MQKKFKPLPKFKSEQEEQEFWATHDSTEYLDWSKAEEAKFEDFPSEIDSNVKKLIELKPVALVTVTPNCNPNAIGVAFVKVISNNQLIITDVYMKQTLIDIAHNPRVVVLAWNEDMQGYKLLGKAKYFTKGKNFDYVCEMEENKDLQPKGAVVVTVERIIKSA